MPRVRHSDQLRSKRSAHLTPWHPDVAYMFKNSNFKHVWPLKLLRFMVSILVTGKVTIRPRWVCLTGRACRSRIRPNCRYPDHAIFV